MPAKTEPVTRPLAWQPNRAQCEQPTTELPAQGQLTRYATAPRPRVPQPEPQRKIPRAAIGLTVAVLALITLALLLPGADSGLPGAGRITLVVFAAAVLAWMFSPLDDTYIGLCAVFALVATGVLSADELFGALGGETIWLLIAAFVLAAGLSSTGLPTRVAVLLIARARSVRGLAHLITAALVLTAFAVPATSGRAALALPVFLGLAKALRDREKVVRALAVLFPAVILLSAVATVVGAGAHLITSQILANTVGTGIGYGQWLLLGAPFAIVSSHLAAELVLLLMVPRAQRRLRLTLSAEQLATEAGTAVRGPLTSAQRRASGILAIVVGLWCTEFLHGMSPALIALFGGLLITAPKLGTVGMSGALGSIPWSLLLFMASTAVLGGALASSGAAGWLTATVFGTGGGSPVPFLLGVIVVSAAAHLVLQSRSARSSVLVPLLVPLAVSAGLNPIAIAFASTVAAGFCHTLPSSAKPVAMFGAVTEVPTYRRTDLLRFSAIAGPLLVLLVLGFALYVWPLLGLSLR
ncbi:anion transporter [Tamaricihabitans halophyticus]|uniref:Anion transporter n=1 Tax=Tamaricihabitans halophyticus TaxID=1262583 RepID=A0A4R2QEF0_9PSEU|nr:SLC13 family permease [Tamaricihabitans halophyticus]TCP45421.1 anion transporter [Tamaricihabitans halophyticus]